MQESFNGKACRPAHSVQSSTKKEEVTATVVTRYHCEGMSLFVAVWTELI